MHKSEAEKIDFILDEHERTFLQQSRIVAFICVLLFITGVVIFAVAMTKSPPLIKEALVILFATGLIIAICAGCVWLKPCRLVVLSRESLLRLMRLTEDSPDARQELRTRLFSGEKLTGRDEEYIRNLWWEEKNTMANIAIRQREQDAIRKFIGKDEQ